VRNKSANLRHAKNHKKEYDYYMTLQEIKQVFEANADAEKGKRDEKYMRGLFLHYGVRSQDRDRLFAALFSKAEAVLPIDWDLVFGLWAEAMRECQYIAVWYIHCKRHHLTKVDIAMLKKLIETKPWWDTIDGLSIGPVGDMVKRDSSLKETMLEWSRDENYWIRRTALQHQLYFKDKVDTELLARIIKNNFGEAERSSPSVDGRNEAQNRAFFINKSIGWVLREYSKTDAEWVRRFIADNKERMSKLSIREASKYI